jgi:hypothetical protein
MSVDHDSRDLFAAADEELLAEHLEPVTAQRWWRRVPTARTLLIAALLAAAGFTGGVLTAKHEGVTTAASTPRTGAAGTGAARTGAGAGQGATTASGATTVGTVKLVDGSTIYVTTTNGSVVKVTTSGATKLSVSATGKASDLKAGQAVVVQGTPDASGNVKATAVTAGSGTGAGTGAGANRGGAAAPTG